MPRNSKKVILPPDLPPEVSEDDIDVSDEDLEFIPQNKDYAAFVSSIDSKSINKSVSRIFLYLSVIFIFPSLPPLTH